MTFYEMIEFMRSLDFADSKDSARAEKIIKKLQAAEHLADVAEDCGSYDAELHGAVYSYRKAGK